MKPRIVPVFDLGPYHWSMDEGEPRLGRGIQQGLFAARYRAEGKTLAQIGAMVGLTPERVRQVTKKAGRYEEAMLSRYGEALAPPAPRV